MGRIPAAASPHPPRHARICHRRWRPLRQSAGTLTRERTPTSSCSRPIGSKSCSTTKTAVLLVTLPRDQFGHSGWIERSSVGGHAMHDPGELACEGPPWPCACRGPPCDARPAVGFASIALNAHGQGEEMAAAFGFLGQARPSRMTYPYSERPLERAQRARPCALQRPPPGGWHDPGRVRAGTIGMGGGGTAWWVSMSLACAAWLLTHASRWWRENQPGDPPARPITWGGLVGPLCHHRTSRRLATLGRRWPLGGAAGGPLFSSKNLASCYPWA